MKRTDKELELQIIEMYNSGASMKKTGEAFGISAVTVKNILERYNIPKRTKGGIYKLPDDEIIKMYTSGKSCQEIANHFNVAFHSISNLLEKHGIERNNRYYNLNLDVNYFENIDSYDKAYFLGFLITDGSVNALDNAVRMELAPKDKYILEKFNEKVNSSNKIYDRKDKPGAVFSVKCQKWKQDLAKYGVVPQKTDSVYLPKLSDEFMPHLIRGMIDGDGWISHKAHQIGFCGNEKCVSQLRDFLVQKLNVYNVKVIHPETNLWQITWASQKDIEAIGNYIYQDKQDCYLTRKYEAFNIIVHGNTEVSK